MSAVLPASWQGRRCALPLHPSGGCHIHHPKPTEICVADCGRGGMCQRNAWPLHHQSGSVPAPRHPMTKGRLRSPLEPIDQPFAGWMPSGLSLPEPRAGHGDCRLHLHRATSKRYVRLIDDLECGLDHPTPSQESRIMLSLPAVMCGGIRRTWSRNANG
jgi:hypothetical protein